MELTYYEIFKLRYQKIINSLTVVYKTLASHNEMAFSLKKLLKETEIFVNSVVLWKTIRSNNFSLELIKQLDDNCQYISLLKTFKLKKIKKFDDILIKRIYEESLNNIKEKPLFIKMSIFFDKTVAKMKLKDDVKMKNVIIDCFKYMFALIDNKDDLTTNLSIYDKDIALVTCHFDGE